LEKKNIVQFLILQKIEKQNASNDIHNKNVKRIKTRRIVSIETAFYEECEIQNAIHCNIKNCSVTENAKKTNRKYQCVGEEWYGERCWLLRREFRNGYGGPARDGYG